MSNPVSISETLILNRRQRVALNWVKEADAPDYGVTKRGLEELQRLGLITWSTPLKLTDLGRDKLANGTIIL